MNLFPCWNFLRNSTSLLDFKLLTSAPHEPNSGIED
jgi:hypothetical protein